MEVVLVGLVIRVPLVLLLAGVILLFGLLLRLFANHATTVTTGGHVVLVAVFSLYVAAKKVEVKKDSINLRNQLGSFFICKVLYKTTLSL